MFALFDPAGDVEISRGTSLPHWFQAGATYFVTFRTDDSLPADVSRRWHAHRASWLARHGIRGESADWREQLQQLPRELRQAFHQTFSCQYLDALDKGYGACLLRKAKLQSIVADALLSFDGQRYHMGDFVVMPNHVHLIVGLVGETRIGELCTSWKRFTARSINRAHGRTGRFWQADTFDHLIRSPEQFDAIQRYIAANPAKLRSGDFLLYQSVRPTEHPSSP